MAGGHGEGIAYKGLTIHKPKRWHTVTGKGLCAVMWLVVILHFFPLSQLQSLYFFMLFSDLFCDNLH